MDISSSELDLISLVLPEVQLTLDQHEGWDANSTTAKNPHITFDFPKT